MERRRKQRQQIFDDVIKFSKFKKFLNDSYNNNDFYIKDITGKISILIDELAINGHVAALPDILNEMWQVMGESGEAIRNSIIWIIETVRMLIIIFVITT